LKVIENQNRDIFITYATQRLCGKKIETIYLLAMTLQAAQQQVDQWIKTHGIRYFNELTNMAILTEEVGELARIIARRYGEQSEKESDKNKDLGDEMADVLWVLICLANQTGVDLTQAFEKNMAKKTARDAERHKANPKLYP
jgi:NTP pyrophosphatase (non-canonical NTP hydrolase)